MKPLDIHPTQIDAYVELEAERERETEIAAGLRPAKEPLNMTEEEWDAPFADPPVATSPVTEPTDEEGNVIPTRALSDLLREQEEAQGTSTERGHISGLADDALIFGRGTIDYGPEPYEPSPYDGTDSAE